MYTYGVKVDIGVSEKHNDDRAFVGTLLVTEGEYFGRIEEEFILASVCDGVGGMAQGYRAATMTLEMMQALHKKGVDAEAIKNTIEEANHMIRSTQVSENLINGLRTTIAGIYADEEKFFVFNAGDSRVYRFRFKYLMRISKDHSLVQDMIDMDEITIEEAMVHPKKNIINKCIGHEETVNPRIIDMSGEFAEGDIIMICSDGITDAVADAEIKDIIIKHKNNTELMDCCNELVSAAKENGSLDNMSVIILRKD